VTPSRKRVAAEAVDENDIGPSPSVLTSGDLVQLAQSSRPFANKDPVPDSWNDRAAENDLE
jgi:hypothetical protein